MAKVYDFYKFVDNKQNQVKMKTLTDSSRQLTEEEKVNKIISETKELVENFCLGFYAYDE